ncbi:MAG: metalloendopeptidase-like membrane protein [Candidatus Berkelbacteria bacterium Gr01-1014_85]|uniref:Metalloendopeptidase-like membrane protein n=1 Tax=Candidatus Berkelbacteria bacterium Gr01-1014_85 TaxID=2017150 RepID=A0A554JCZ2_9BACT|nr:MAG: metalloendopeptidase-like membrane protein [Candidatus Berkelbacteria bacterium Gr01-1014_85]
MLNRSLLDVKSWPRWVFLILGIALILIISLALFKRPTENVVPLSTGLDASASPEPSALNSSTASALTSAPSSTPSSALVTFDTANLAGASQSYNFTLSLPSDWQVEYLSDIDSLNLYSKTASGSNKLEQSQILIRNFVADKFLTLSTVKIYQTTDRVINGRLARQYDIEKKPEAASFKGQPSWRNLRHQVVDVQVGRRYYVIAKSPDLDNQLFEQILATFMPRTAQAQSLVPPTQDFRSRINLKTFGQLIDPESSPVQPERFSGYHTGVDIEHTKIVGVDVPVVAIADGIVKLSQKANGYGGVVIMWHTISGQTRSVLYGHLDPARLPKIGQTIAAGKTIGYLGVGQSAETDGERRHLHLSIRSDTALELAGYTKTATRLNEWLNPLDYF